MTDFTELFDYHNWANERLCLMLHDAFGDEQNLGQSLSPIVLALHQTVVHLIGAEQIWRTRIEGSSPMTMLVATDYPSVPAIRVAFEKERRATQTFLDSLTSDRNFDRVVTTFSTKGEPRVFPIKTILHHIVNHSTYHWGQITARLIDLGHETAILPTDFTTFFMEHPPDSVPQT